MQSNLIPYDDMWRMALAIHKAGMFGLKTPEAAIGLFLMAQAEGMHPMTALRRFHILSDGRASMRADAMLADFRTKVGGTVKWLRHDATSAVGLWKVGDSELEIGYTMEEARAAGYVKPGSGWMKDPAAMLRARCISRAIRMLAPEVVAGLYTPEELSDGDWTPPAPVEPVKEPAKAIAAPPPPDPVVADTRTWEEVLGEKREDAIQYLRVVGWLKEGQGLDDLKEAHSKRIRGKTEAFLLAVQKDAELSSKHDPVVEAAKKAVRDVVGGE